MEILYIWIKNYKLFKDCEFNLSYKYRFNFNEELLELKNTQEQKKINNFYLLNENNNTCNFIDNISVIVGDNGSGKTSLCGFLFDIFINYISTEYIIVYELDSSIYMDYYILPRILDENKYKKIIDLLERIELIKDYRTNYFKLSYELFEGKYYLKNKNDKDLIAMLKEIKINENIKFDISKENINKLYNFFDLIYYSPHYTIQNFLFTLQNSEHKFIDISTSYLINNDLTHYHNARTGVNYNEKRIDKISAHNIKDMRRIIFFLKDYIKINKEKNINIFNNFPLSIIITIDENDANYFKSEYLSENNKELNTFFEKIERKIFNEKNKINNIKKKFLISLAKAIIMNYLRTFFAPLSGKDLIKDAIIIKIIERLSFFSENNNISECCVKFFNDIINQKITIDGKESEFSWKGTVERASLIEYINKKISKKNFENEHYLILDLEKEVDFILSITELYFNSEYITEYLNFTFSPILSSGEISILTFYSRLYEILKKDDDLNENIIIFFDEVETTLHPIYQKKIVKDLLLFINHFFQQKKYQIHLIFATHSPIILSNIIPQNCVFLKKEKNNCIVYDYENFTGLSTFGANIYNLYRHPFFMENGLSGEFAEDKINEVISLLNKDVDLDEEQNNYCKFIIDNIGEPVIKKQIYDKYLKKIKMNKDLEMINYYKGKIKEIEDKLEDDKNI